MKIALFFIAVSVFLLGCQENTVSQKELEEELMNTSRAWTNSKTTDETMSFWADDALVMAPGQATIRGKEAIREMVDTSKEFPDLK